MKITGGCYCKSIRYVAEGEPQGSIQCHCRECQYITGGNPNVFMLMPLEGFAYTQGEPKTFSRSDLERPVTRHFCGNCGTAIGTRSPMRPGSMVLKVGTFDDPSIYQPKAAIFTIDRQSFHYIPEGILAFERRPG
jgi:hypothetical protein